MIVAVDVCIGKRGVQMLRDAGHTVIEAEHGEPDREWFDRAIRANARLFVAADNDIRILAYDNRRLFFRAWTNKGLTGVEVADYVLRRIAKIEIRS